MRFKLHALLFVLAGMMLAACGSEPTHPRDGRDIDNLEIFRPALSPDGRYMVFDFVEYASDPNDQALATRNHLALYDIEAQSVVVMAPNDPMYSYNSASFVGDERMLVAVQHCWSEDCPPEDLGHQIVILDLQEQRARRVTDGRKSSYLWWTIRQSVPPKKFEYEIIRTHPIFVPSETAIYYMALRRGDFGAVPAFGEHVSQPRRQLMRVNLESGEESLVMGPESGALEFRQFGRVALAGNRRLVFSGGWPSMGENAKAFNDIHAKAFFLDLETKRLSPLFPNPPYFDDTTGRSSHRGLTFWPLSLTSSADGSRIAFVDQSHDAGQMGVWVREDGLVREPLDLTSYKIRRAAFVALSGSGEHLAILDDQSNQHFLIMNLENGQVLELPLRAPLREAIREARNTQV